MCLSPVETITLITPLFASTAMKLLLYFASFDVLVLDETQLIRSSLFRALQYTYLK